MFLLPFRGGCCTTDHPGEPGCDPLLRVLVKKGCAAMTALGDACGDEAT